MSTCLIRNIDPEVWGRFKARAAREGTSAQATLMRFIESYAAARYRVQATAFEEPHYLAIMPGSLTTDTKVARMFPNTVTAGAAIKEARTLFGRDEDLVVVEVS